MNAYSFGPGLPVRICLQAAIPTNAAAPASLTLYTVDGVARTLGATERLLIHWFDIGDIAVADDSRVIVTDGIGTALVNTIGHFSSRQVGVLSAPIVGRQGFVPAIAMPDGDGGSHTLIGMGTILTV